MKVIVFIIESFVKTLKTKNRAYYRKEVNRFMSEQLKYPPVKEKSAFYQLYSRVSTVSMLMDLGFSVSETQIDNEDIVYIEQYKEFLLGKGIVEEKVPFRREFIAIYPLSKTRRLVVEGYYLRKPSGEKMYGSYYYDFYSEEYSGMLIHCTKATKSFFLHVFEQRIGRIKKIKHRLEE